MKIRQLLFGLFLFISFSLQSQSFVNTANQWYIDDCCSSVGSGGLSCNTNYYEFGNPTSLGGKMYYKLIHDNASPLFGLGEYYREENGKVYLKESSGSDEVLIYDFNASVGDEMDLGENLRIVVEAIDSVEMISGAKRKRLSVAALPNQNRKATWIEGIGSILSPMDTRKMFSFDCYVDLDCYFENGIVEYSIKDCSLTTGIDEINPRKKSVQIFPNPSSDQLNIKPLKDTPIIRTEVLNLDGKRLLQVQHNNVQNLSVGELNNGIYLLRLVFADGQQQILKFVKGE